MQEKGSPSWSEDCPCLLGKVILQVQAIPVWRGERVQILNAGRAGKALCPLEMKPVTGEEIEPGKPLSTPGMPLPLPGNPRLPPENSGWPRA
jgi:hypothetical protein